MSIQESVKCESAEVVEQIIGTNLNYTHKIDWIRVGVGLLLHIFAVWGLFLVLRGEVKWETILWAIFVNITSTIGVSVGAHRYYSHKSFKATSILEVLLIIMQTAAGQFSIFAWSRDHRLHHRYSDTDADPHNIKRGFFFSYLGWLLTKRNKYVLELGKRVPMRDLTSNKLVMFQKRYYFSLFFVFGVLIPTLIPICFFDESWWKSLLVAYILRYVLISQYTALLIAFGHMYGTRPYNRNIQPVESKLLTILSGGDGNHNFHHVFPWDFKTAENSNFMSIFITICRYFGLAYDLKTASKDSIKAKVYTTGDGMHDAFVSEEAKTKVKAWGPIHPLNPTYTSIRDPEITTRITVPKTLLSSDIDCSRE